VRAQATRFSVAAHIAPASARSVAKSVSASHAHRHGRLRTTDLVSKMPSLEAYRLRCEARPTFKKALDAQMATFTANAPPGA
jgi:hypothetical protein